MMNKMQNEACDIIERLNDMDYDFTDMLIVLIYNYNDVAEHILNNYGECLKWD